MTFFWVVLALLLHLVPEVVDPGRTQISRKDDIVSNSRGLPLAGPNMRVCAMPATGQPCTPQTLANPTTSGGLSNYFFHAAPSAGGVNLYTKSADEKLDYQDESGRLGTGGGAKPGNDGDLQSKKGTAPQKTGINDDGTGRSITRDQQSTGPNPHFDIRAYGGTVAGGRATNCAITSGGRILTCAQNPDFLDAGGIPGSSLGHGVFVPGAGALPTIVTPGRPTVTPNLLNGATTWNYKVIAEDYKGGLTAATAAGATTTGRSALGITTISVTSATRKSGVTTYTTTSAHNLSAGMAVILCKFGRAVSCNGGDRDPFNGTKVIVSTPTPTSFTTSEGDVADGSESPASGQVNVLACNTLTFAPGTFSGVTTLRYWIYRSQGAGPYSLAGVAVGLDPWWQDCGASAPNAPSYVPSTPLRAPQAGYLVTTVASGGATRTMTLAAAADTTVSGKTVLHDNGPAVLAASAAAVNQGGGTVYIPSTANDGGSTTLWAFYGVTNFKTLNPSNSNYITILINGHVGLNNPWTLRSRMKIEGMTKRNSSFMYPGGASLGGFAQPILYVNTENSIMLRNLFIQPHGAQTTGLYADSNSKGDGSNGIILENVAVVPQNGVGFARPMVLKGGFDYFFRQTTCDPQSGSMILPHACIEFTNSSTAVFNGTSQIPGRVVFDSCYIDSSGILIDDQPNANASGGNGYTFNHCLAEGLYTPFLKLGPMASTNGFSLSDIIDADHASGVGTPLVEATRTSLADISVREGLNSGGNPPVVIGGNSGAVAALSTEHVPSTNLGNIGGFRVTTYDVQVKDQPLSAQGSGHFIYTLATPAALSGCLVSAGGSVPVGAHSYALAAVDADGNETLLGPAVSATTTSGNQTVTCTLPAKPPGAIGFDIYQDRFRVSPGTCTPPQLTGTTMVLSGRLCGNSNPNINAAGSSVLSSLGITTYREKAVDASGFRVTKTPLNLTANRSQTYPDKDGSFAILSAGQSISTVPGTLAIQNGPFNTDHVPFGDSSGRLIDGVAPMAVYDSFNGANGPLTSHNSNWFVQSGAIQINGNAAQGNSSGQNYAAYTGVSFPTDDQTAEIVYGKVSTAPSPSALVTVRQSTSVLSNYSCGGNANGSVTLNKYVSGSATLLASFSHVLAQSDVLTLNAIGSTITCYLNGTKIMQATDSSVTGGYPGIAFSNTSTTAQIKSWRASYGGVSLNIAQTWNQMQTFSPGIAIGAEAVSSAPRSTLGSFFPGALTSVWNGNSWTLDKAITVTRFQAQAKTAPAGCTTNAVIQLSDGRTPVKLTVAAAANDSGAIGQNYAAGATLTVSVQTASAGCTTSPSDANAVIQYRMQ